MSWIRVPRGPLVLDHVHRLRVFAGIGVGLLMLGAVLVLGGDVRVGGGAAAAGLGLALWEVIGLWLTARKRVASGDTRRTAFRESE